MLVDDSWALVGSSNWDARSLRLNFEFNVEAYDRSLVAELTKIFEQKKADSDEASLSALQARPLALRLRDGVFRLFTPYL
jgi:cardiolipin synthase